MVDNKWYLYLIIILVVLLVGMSLYVRKLKQVGVEELKTIIESNKGKVLLLNFW